jgi:hypothetical protein
MSASVFAHAAVPGSTAPPGPEPITEATLSAVAPAVLPVFVLAPFVEVLAAVPTPDTGHNTTTAGGPSLLTRRGARGILES